MFSDPRSILEQAPIMQGSTACDIGAGSGFYTLPLSIAVGDKGKVYAVDIQKNLLAKIDADMKAHNRHNVEVIWGDAEKPAGTKLRDATCDCIVLANILFQIEKKNADVMADELRRILKPKGFILVIDWVDKGATKPVVQALFSKYGFVFDRDIEAGLHHYGMILKKT